MNTTRCIRLPLYDYLVSSIGVLAAGSIVIHCTAYVESMGYLDMPILGHADAWTCQYLDDEECDVAIEIAK